MRVQHKRGTLANLRASSGIIL